VTLGSCRCSSPCGIHLLRSRPLDCRARWFDEPELRLGPSGLNEGFIPLQPSRAFNSATSVVPVGTLGRADALTADISLQLKVKVSPWRSVIRGTSERCQTTDLAVGGSNPSRRATNTAGQRPCDGIAAGRRAAGLRPNCDHVDGHSQHDCDHLRPQSPMPAAFLLVSGGMEAPTGGG
jgi:hypothetical protein